MKIDQEKACIRVIKFSKKVDVISQRMLFVMGCAEVGALITSASSGDLINPASTSITGIVVLTGTVYLTNTRLLNNTRIKLTSIQNQHREEKSNQKRA